MSLADRVKELKRALRLDSHHAIERFGAVFTALVASGVVIVGVCAASAFVAEQERLADTALYTPAFTTSKTDLSGGVEGVYVNDAGSRALVMMRFEDRAQISYDAGDYQGFLLGSRENLSTEPVATAGVTGSAHVFGSTGYVGVLLEAEERFASQVLNLTMRANAELTFDDRTDGGRAADELAGDPSFEQFDQWRVFFNPGADGATELDALNRAEFDAGQVYYEVVARAEEEQVRGELDRQLERMRADLARIDAYEKELAATKVDGLHLRPPDAPASLREDQVTGQTAAEAPGGVATLRLQTDHVVAGGFDVNWRAGNVLDGYLEDLVPAGARDAEFLSHRLREPSDSTRREITSMEWVLSDGSSLTEDYRASDVVMRPLVTVMNNLSQAYADYHSSKRDYQGGLLFELLALEVQVRDVQANSSTTRGPAFLTTHD